MSLFGCHQWGWNVLALTCVPRGVTNTRLSRRKGARIAVDTPLRCAGTRFHPVLGTTCLATCRAFGNDWIRSELVVLTCARRAAPRG